MQASEDDLIQKRDDVTPVSAKCCGSASESDEEKLPPSEADAKHSKSSEIGIASDPISVPPHISRLTHPPKTPESDVDDVKLQNGFRFEPTDKKHSLQSTDESPHKQFDEIIAGLASTAALIDDHHNKSGSFAQELVKKVESGCTEIAKHLQTERYALIAEIQCIQQENEDDTKSMVTEFDAFLSKLQSYQAQIEKLKESDEAQSMVNEALAFYKHNNQCAWNDHALLKTFALKVSILKQFDAVFDIQFTKDSLTQQLQLLTHAADAGDIVGDDDDDGDVGDGGGDDEAEYISADETPKNRTHESVGHRIDYYNDGHRHDHGEDDAYDEDNGYDPGVLAADDDWYYDYVPPSSKVPRYSEERSCDVHASWTSESSRDWRGRSQRSRGRGVPRGHGRYIERPAPWPRGRGRARGTGRGSRARARARGRGRGMRGRGRGRFDDVRYDDGRGRGRYDDGRDRYRGRGRDNYRSRFVTRGRYSSYRDEGGRNSRSNYYDSNYYDDYGGYDEYDERSAAQPPMYGGGAADDEYHHTRDTRHYRSVVPQTSESQQRSRFPRARGGYVYNEYVPTTVPQKNDDVCNAPPSLNDTGLLPSDVDDGGAHHGSIRGESSGKSSPAKSVKTGSRSQSSSPRKIAKLSPVPRTDNASPDRGKSASRGRGSGGFGGGRAHHIFVQNAKDLDFDSVRIKRQYRDVVVICQFSDQFHSKNGLKLLSNRTVLFRAENQKHGYAILDSKPVNRDTHCWRVKCKNFTPWVFIGVSRANINFTDTSWNNKYVWGISTCSQSNRNGYWSLDYSVKTPHWKNKHVLCVDMLLDVDHGVLKYKRILNHGEQRKHQLNGVEADEKTVVLDGLRTSDDKGGPNISWVPHFNLHTPGTTISVKKIPPTRFGELW